MGKVLVEKLLPNFQKLPLPKNTEPTIQARQTYEIGLEKVDEYRSEPKTLLAALRIFQTCDSQPCLFAGLAYTLLAAAKESDDSYAQIGLDAAMEWLEKAQDLAPDVVSINMIEPLIYIHSGRYEDARLVLDYLKGIEPQNFYLMRIEPAYWQGMEMLEEAVESYEKAIDKAGNVPQKLRLRNQLGDCYLQFGEDEKALEIYQEAVHFLKEDPWLWHNLSIAYYNHGNYQEAHRANRIALDLSDLPEAREMEKALRSNLGTGGGLVNRLLGR